MDNPASWAVLCLLAIVFVIWFAYKCDAEISRNRRENDDFFWKKENGFRK